MKRRRTRKFRMGVVAVAMAIGMISLTVAALVSPSIGSFTADCGGGTIYGASYALSGAIGQPDAGVMQGGTFQIYGGFWGTAPTPPANSTHNGWAKYR